MISSFHRFASRVFSFLFENKEPLKMAKFVKALPNLASKSLQHLYLVPQFFGRDVMLTAVAKMRSSDAIARNFELAQPRPLAFSTFYR